MERATSKKRAHRKDLTDRSGCARLIDYDLIHSERLEITQDSCVR